MQLRSIVDRRENELASHAKWPILGEKTQSWAKKRNPGPKSRVFGTFFDTASTLDGIIWGRFMAIGPYGVSPFLMRSLHTVYPAVDLAEKPRIGV